MATIGGVAGGSLTLVGNPRNAAMVGLAACAVTWLALATWVPWRRPLVTVASQAIVAADLLSVENTITGLDMGSATAAAVDVPVEAAGPVPVSPPEAGPCLAPQAVLPTASVWRRGGQWLVEVVYAAVVVVAAVVAFGDWRAGPFDVFGLWPVLVPAVMFAVLVCQPSWPREPVVLDRFGIAGKATWARITRVDVSWGWRGGRVVRVVLDDRTRVPVGMASSIWPDRRFTASLRQLIAVGRHHNPRITVRHRTFPLWLAALALVQVATVAGISVWQRGLIGGWEPVASGQVPACAALKADGGRRWPGSVRWENKSTPGREFTSCTWGFGADVDRAWPMRAKVDVVTHRWRPTRSPIAAAIYRHRYDRDAMVSPQPLPGVGDEAAMTTHVDYVEVVARRANVTLVLRLYYAGDVRAAQDAATAIAAETLHRVELRSVLAPVPHITRRQ